MLVYSRGSGIRGLLMPKRRRKRVYKKLEQYVRRCPRCSKILYREKKEASDAAKRYRKRVGSKMSVYHCIEYDGYHIGHTRLHKGRKSGKKKDLFDRVK